VSDLPKTDPVVFRIPNGSGAVDEIVIDACVTEQHTLTNTLTDHPVEQGSNITDHSRPEPRRVTLDCVQSNTPPNGRAATSTRPDRKNPAASDGDYAHQLWERFVQLHNSPKLVAVDTVRDFYESMGIESITSPVDAKSASALKFTIGLKEVRVVQNKFTQVKPTKTPAGQAKKNAGKASTKDADGSSTEKNNSTLKDALGLGKKALSALGGG
jgi:hypothetical protein